MEQMDRLGIVKAIARQAAAVLERTEDELVKLLADESADLLVQLEMEELDLLQLVSQLEKDLSIYIPSDAFHEIKTVKNLLDTVDLAIKDVVARKLPRQPPNAFETMAQQFANM